MKPKQTIAKFLSGEMNRKRKAWKSFALYLSPVNIAGFFASFMKSNLERIGL